MPPTTSRKSRSMTQKFQILGNEFSTENDNYDSPRTAKMTAVMIWVDSVQEFLSHVRSRLIVVLKQILHQVVYYSFQTNEKSRDPDETKSQKKFHETKFQDYVFWISFPKKPEIANALFEKMDTKIHPEKWPLFRHGRRHARIYICHYLITIKLVLNMVKAAKKPVKALKKNNTSQSSSSSSSAT